MILGENVSVGSSWSRDEDIAFERALAIYADENENRWEKIALVVPGKTKEQIIEHYNVLVRDVTMIESGLVPLPACFGFSEEPNHNASGQGKSALEYGEYHRKTHDKSKPKQTRKRGIPWTSTEHRQFLLGLEKFGKGDWRSISRHFVLTRTSTQVASHAQKYYQRLNSKNKHKNRASIHDVTVAGDKPKQRAITWQTFASTSNNQLIQPASQPSLELPIHGRRNIWNTQATQAISQPPALNHPTAYGVPTTIWNAATLQPSANFHVYGTPTISQPMVGPMLSPFGTNMNRLAQPHMTSGVHFVPSYSGPNAPINMGSIPYDIKPKDRS
ncbi:hypothetical protein CARUB_v10003231mg [Capsella rubella]|uniref:Uncharacterized protein n=1 Tax=Capsella rubella TaxID=81985 RepID=R0HC28_9BRAS|nr:transcription factor SRM1 [Capsella rubella]EOA22570.1 hypothetical protein CARUB_v10003231mg [Capsella rubella]